MKFSTDLPKYEKVKKVGVTISLDEKNVNRLKRHLKEYHDDAPISWFFDSILSDWIKHVSEHEKRVDDSNERKKNKKEEDGENG